MEEPLSDLGSIEDVFLSQGCSHGLFRKGVLFHGDSFFPRGDLGLIDSR